MSKPKPSTIDSKQKELNYLLVNDRENPKVKELKAYIDYYFYGIKC